MYICVWGGEGYAENDESVLLVTMYCGVYLWGIIDCSVLCIYYVIVMFVGWTEPPVCMCRKWQFAAGEVVCTRV